MINEKKKMAENSYLNQDEVRLDECVKKCKK